MNYEINFEALEKLDPELYIRAKECLAFRGSDFGKYIQGHFEELIDVTKSTVVSAINQGNLEDAKAGAALVDGLTVALRILYEEPLEEAEALTAL